MCEGVDTDTEDPDAEDTGDIEENPLDTDDDGDGYTENEGDCDDSEYYIHPGADDYLGDGIDEDCDGTDGTDADGDGHAGEAYDCDDTDPNVGSILEDQDCDGSPYSEDCDDNDPELNWQDNDGDFHSTCGTYSFDCNDNDPTIYTGATEIPEDGIDQDCDGEDYFEPCCYTLNMFDSEGDGWGK